MPSPPVPEAGQTVAQSAPAAVPAGLSFEDALAELERIVRGLEGGQQRLEDAIAAYERGSALRQHCEARLREAEMRVERIVAAGTQPASGPAQVVTSEEIPF